MLRNNSFFLGPGPHFSFISGPPFGGYFFVFRHFRFARSPSRGGFKAKSRWWILGVPTRRWTRGGTTFGGARGMGRKRRNRKRPFQQGPRAKVEVFRPQKTKSSNAPGRFVTYVYANGAIFRFRRGTRSYFFGGARRNARGRRGEGGVRYISRFFRFLQI